MGAAFITWEEFEGLGLPTSMGFHSVLSETHTKTVTTTDHNIEKGSKITDHVIKEPELSGLEVLVSNQPIVNTDLFGNRIGGHTSLPLDVPTYEPEFAPTPGAVFSAIGSAVMSLISKKKEYSALVIKFASSQNHCKIAQDTLWKLIDDATLITVTTGTRVYENMILTDAPMTRRPDLGDAVQFSLQFKKLNIVETRGAFLPAETIAKKKVDKGQKSPTQEEPKSGVARRLLDDWVPSWAKNIKFVGGDI